MSQKHRPALILPINYEEADYKLRQEVRNEYVKVQHGKCCHCGESLDHEPVVKAKTINHKLFPTNFFKWPIHIHHDHKTGMTIGAVHNYCNALLWQYFGK